MIILVFSFSSVFLSNSELKESSSEILLDNQNETNPKVSSTYNDNIIVFFNRSSYNNTVKNTFISYGGTIKTEWNNKFNSISGFAGVMPNETNIILYQQDFPDAYIENDEILEAQMNYASIQSGAINSTWYLNGLKGNTNSSVAVLDTGINPNHNFFPNGYNQLDFSSDIIGWENFVDTQPISDDNGHG
ncbi:MAG: S8 family serine peptidase, partial [Candidatus Hodarchaeota archaeon]